MCREVFSDAIDYMLPPVSLSIAPGFWSNLDADTCALDEVALDQVCAAGVTLVTVAEACLQEFTRLIGSRSGLRAGESRGGELQADYS